MQESKIWFPDLKKASEIRVEQLKELGETIKQGIDAGKLNASSFNQDLVKDTAARIVFISASNGITPASIYMGKGIGIVNAIKDSFLRFWREWGAYKGDRVIKIDIVKSFKSLGNLELDSKFTIETSLDGLAFSSASNVALIPELVSANAIIDDNGYLENTRLFNAIAHNPLMAANYAKLTKDGTSDVFTFKTSGILIQNKQVSLLYRGRRAMDYITLEDLRYRLELAASYLVRSMYASGRFDYIYHPNKNRSSSDYNIIRHAGTICSMLEYHKTFPNYKVLNAAKQALQYLVQHMLPGSDVEDSLCLVEKGSVALGGNALAAIAFAKYIEVSEDKGPLPILLKLGEWIIAKLQKNGEFLPQKQFYLKGVPSKKNYSSPYFPGEAILALLWIYMHDKNPKWLDAAEKAAVWLITVRDKDVKDSELNHDHWLLYGLNDLYRHRDNPIFLKHTIRLCNAIFKKQHTKGEYPDWYGGFYNPPRSTPAATRAEGLFSAYFLIKDFGKNKKLLNQIFESLKQSIAFQFRTQYLPEYAMYFLDPKSALGGFHSSLTSHDIRIDFIQHNISSLLGLYRIMKETNSGQRRKK